MLKWLTGKFVIWSTHKNGTLLEERRYVDRHVGARVKGRELRAKFVNFKDLVRPGK
jgi:hypothetical protein